MSHVLLVPSTYIMRVLGCVPAAPATVSYVLNATRLCSLLRMARL